MRKLFGALLVAVFLLGILTSINANFESADPSGGGIGGKRVTASEIIEG